LTFLKIYKLGEKWGGDGMSEWFLPYPWGFTPERRYLLSGVPRYSCLNHSIQEVRLFF